MLSLSIVEQRTKDDPYNQQHIGLLAEVNAAETGNRYQLQYNEGDGEQHADCCHSTQEQGAITITLCGNQRRSTSEEVADGCTDGAHIHKPAQCLTTQNRTGQGRDDAKSSHSWEYQTSYPPRQTI